MEETSLDENGPFRQYAKEQTRQVCKNLGQLCKRAGARQEDIAELIGYNQPNLSRLFAGRYSPRAEVFFYILNAVNQLKGTTYTLADIDVSEPQTPE